jgi:hypothetical protein
MHHGLSRVQTTVLTQVLTEYCKEFKIKYAPKDFRYIDPDNESFAINAGQRPTDLGVADDDEMIIVKQK